MCVPIYIFVNVCIHFVFSILGWIIIFVVWIYKAANDSVSNLSSFLFAYTEIILSFFLLECNLTHTRHTYLRGGYKFCILYNYLIDWFIVQIQMYIINNIYLCTYMEGHTHSI